MKKRVFVTVFLVGASWAFAGPDTVSYQGSLLAAGGTPVADGQYRMQFTLFDAASAGNNRWQETDNVQVTGGLFATTLGDGTPFAGVFLTYPNLWLAVEIDVDQSNTFEASEVFSPRQNVSGAPWSAPRLEPRDGAPNLVGGYSGNNVTAGVYGATIGGGGDGAGANVVTDNHGTVSGGHNNQAGDNAGTTSDRTYATVGGGQSNTASGWYATVGGGGANTASGQDATIGGGANNAASAGHSTVGGGEENTASGAHATIAGGYQNTASHWDAVVAGGIQNTASGANSTVGGGIQCRASEQSATVAGGWYNSAGANAATVCGGASNASSGSYSVVCGGGRNAARGNNSMVVGGDLCEANGNFSFAAGRRAKANTEGSFVWADSTDADLESNVANQFRVRATGGIYFFSGGGNGPFCPPNGTDFVAFSDRNAKENFRPVDGREVLEKLAEISITTWNFKHQEDSWRHIGPMAQDFYAAFGVGYDDRHIDTLDVGGAALAAIQGLHEMALEKDARIAAQQQQITTLQEQNASLEARVAALESLVTNSARLAALERP